MTGLRIKGHWQEVFDISLYLANSLNILPSAPCIKYSIIITLVYLSYSCMNTTSVYFRCIAIC